MAESKIPVNLFNPGQVFACLGLVEISDALSDDTEGGFDWSDFSAPRFCLRTAGDKCPVERALRFIKEAEITVHEPVNWTMVDQKKWKETWEVERKKTNDSFFPIKKPESPATLPITLSTSEAEIYVDHWGDKTRRDRVKFWSGMGGYPGAVMAQDAQNLIPLDLKGVEIGNPFDFSKPQSNSFGFDKRRAYIPIDSGFTPNKHKKIAIAGFPVVELLAAIGMRYARPLRVKHLQYRYAVSMNPHSGKLFPPIFLRAALGAEKVIISGILLRHFRMFLDNPGQESRIRMVTNVIEESDK